MLVIVSTELTIPTSSTDSEYGDGGIALTVAGSQVHGDGDGFSFPTGSITLAGENIGDYSIAVGGGSTVNDGNGRVQSNLCCTHKELW